MVQIKERWVRRIAEYRWRYTLYALLCWVLLIFGFIRNGLNSESFQFWFAQSLFLLMGAWLTYMLLSSGNKFIGRKGELFNRELAEESAKLEDEDGVFRFHDKGFSFLADPVAPVFIPWSEISAIYAWVEDQLNNDDLICLRLEYGNGRFLEFEEDTPGYLKFIRTASFYFPGLSGSWQSVILELPDRKMKLAGA